LEKKEYLKTRSVVDFGLLGGLSLTNLGNLKGLWEAGALGFKGFTCALHEADALGIGNLMEILGEENDAAARLSRRRLLAGAVLLTASRTVGVQTSAIGHRARISDIKIFCPWRKAEELFWPSRFPRRRRRRRGRKRRSIDPSLEASGSGCDPALLIMAENSLSQSRLCAFEKRRFIAPWFLMKNIHISIDLVEEHKKNLLLNRRLRLDFLFFFRY
jgi:hypothetical protein